MTHLTQPVYSLYNFLRLTGYGQTIIHALMEKVSSFAKFSFVFNKGDGATLLFCEVMIQILNTM